MGDTREELAQEVRKPSPARQKVMDSRQAREDAKKQKQEAKELTRQVRQEGRRAIAEEERTRRIEKGDWRNDKERAIWQRVLDARPTSAPGGTIPVSGPASNPEHGRQTRKPPMFKETVQGGGGGNAAAPAGPVRIAATREVSPGTYEAILIDVYGTVVSP